MQLYGYVLYTQNYPEECATALIPLFTCSKLSSTPNRDLRHVQLESPGGTGQVQIVNMDGENGWTMLDIAEPTKTIEESKQHRKEKMMKYDAKTVVFPGMYKSQKKGIKRAPWAPLDYFLFFRALYRVACAPVQQLSTPWQHALGLGSATTTECMSLVCKTILQVRLQLCSECNMIWSDMVLIYFYSTILYICSSCGSLVKFSSKSRGQNQNRKAMSGHEALMQSFDKTWMLSILPGLNSAWFPRWRQMEKRSSHGSKSGLVSKTINLIYICQVHLFLECEVLSPNSMWVLKKGGPVRLDLQIRKITLVGVGKGLKVTIRTWKLMIGKRSFPFGMA